MAHTRGISEEEERERGKRAIETITQPKKDWGETKFRGFHICAVCGGNIRKKRGETAERHEKKRIRVDKNKFETFWTYRHRKCRPKKKGVKNERS